MDFFDLAKTPKVHQRTSHRVTGAHAEYGFFEPSIREEQQHDGSWIGYKDGNTFYQVEKNPVKPEFEPDEVLGGPANIHLLSIPQIASFNPFDYEIASLIKSHIKNISPIKDRGTLSRLTDISVQSLDLMAWSDFLVVRPLQNINRIHYDGNIESEHLTSAQRNSLKNYIDTNGYILDRNELDSVLNKTLRKKLNKEGVMAAPPVNIHHLSRADIEKIVPSASDLYSKIEQSMSDGSMIGDLSDIQGVDPFTIDDFNLQQLEMMGVLFRGVANINHSEDVKDDFNAILLDEVPGTNNSEDDLQSLIDTSGFVFNTNDIGNYMNEPNEKFARIFQSVGLLIEGLQNFNDFTRSMIENTTPLQAKTVGKIISSINQNKPFSSIDQLPDAVINHEMVIALKGLAAPLKNINTLPESDLKKLPALNSDDAERIVAYRRKEGDILNFKNFESALKKP